MKISVSILQKDGGGVGFKSYLNKALQHSYANDDARKLESSRQEHVEKR